MPSPDGPATIDLTAKFASGANTGTDTLRRAFKWIAGSDEGDTITGDFHTQIVWGGGGSDDISSGGGDDQVAGEAGDDELRGGDGDRDLLDYSASEQAVTVDLPAGQASGPGTDDIGGFENVWGASHADNVLIGDAARNRLRMGKERNEISGGAGNDEVSRTTCRILRTPVYRYRRVRRRRRRGPLAITGRLPKR